MVTLANAHNLSAGRGSTSGNKEPTVFMTHSELEVMLRREKEKAYVSSVYLDLKPPYVCSAQF